MCPSRASRYSKNCSAWPTPSCTSRNARNRRMPPGSFLKRTSSTHDGPDATNIQSTMEPPPGVRFPGCDFRFRDPTWGNFGESRMSQAASLLKLWNASAPLRLLLIEHAMPDAELVIHELEKAGFHCRAQIVGTREEFLAQFPRF